MRRAWARLLPASLAGRIFLLFGLTVGMPLVLGMALFLRYAFTSGIEDTLTAGQTLAEVVTPTINESLVIGDYDTVHRTLLKMVRNPPFESAVLIDMKGGRIEAHGRPDARAWVAPAWFAAQVTARTADVNIVSTVGGRDYGVLRLSFSGRQLADQLWFIAITSLGLGLLTLLVATVVMRVSMRAWLTPLDRIRAGGLGLDEVARTGAPIEISNAVDAFARREQQMRLQRITADATLAAVGDGVVTLDAQGVVVYVNRAAADILSREAPALCGNKVWEVLPQLMHAEGGPGPELLARRWRVDGRGESRHGHWRSLDLALGPIWDAAERPIGHVLTLRDVTERQAYEERLQSELETRRSAARALQATLHDLLGVPVPQTDTRSADGMDLDAVARLIADLVQQREADRRALNFQKHAQDEHAAITIADAQGRIIYANDKMLELSDFARPELLGQRHNVLSSGAHSPEFFADLWRTISSGQTWHGEIIDRNRRGERLWLETTIVPALDARGQVHQYIAIRTDISRLRRIEQALAEAQARELETARLIQTVLLIGELPQQLDGVDLASYNRASRGIDGDFFAITQFNPDCFELLVGDVMGKGVPAALVGAAVRTTYSRVVSELMAQHLQYDSALPSAQDIVRVMHSQMTPRLVALETFVTLALYRFDLAQGRLAFVNAGHTPGLLLPPVGPVQRLLGDNLPLGVLPTEHYVQQTVALPVGAALLAYSDGITEARSASGEEFGEARLAEVLDSLGRSGASADMAVQALRQRLADFVDPAWKPDDETAVLVRLTGPEASLYPPLKLRRQLDELPRLREALNQIGRAAGMAEDAVDRMVLASFEAATNVIRHAPPPFEDATLNCCIVPGDAHIEVHLWYVGAPFAPPSELRPDFSGHSEGGFGLYIIRSLCQRLAFEHPSEGLNHTVLCFALSANESGQDETRPLPWH